MELFAFSFGVFWGWVCLRNNLVVYLLTIYHYYFFRSKHGFMQVYELADDELSYQYFTDTTKTVKSYADYLRLHEKVKPSAYRRFRSLYSSLVKIFTYKVVPIALIPAILFCSNGYIYLLGILLVLTAMCAYKIIVKNNGPGFYQRLVVYSVLTNYLNEKRTKAK